MANEISRKIKALGLIQSIQLQTLKESQQIRKISLEIDLLTVHYWSGLSVTHDITEVVHNRLEQRYLAQEILKNLTTNLTVVKGEEGG